MLLMHRHIDALKAERDEAQAENEQLLNTIKLSYSAIKTVPFAGRENMATTGELPCEIRNIATEVERLTEENGNLKKTVDLTLAAMATIAENERLNVVVGKALKVADDLAPEYDTPEFRFEGEFAVQGGNRVKHREGYNAIE